LKQIDPCELFLIQKKKSFLKKKSQKKRKKEYDWVFVDIIGSLWGKIDKMYLSGENLKR
jgi:hypothetical protein